MNKHRRRVKARHQPARASTEEALFVPDGYELLRLLGRGGCAVVYEARHPKHGIVALKLTEGNARFAGSVDRRLSREGELLARISHENVLRVYDAGRTPDGAPYLVMEFLHGEDIESILLRKGPLRTPFACEILRQVLTALEAVHAAGIVHRDLKPNNVMIDVPENGSRPVVKLIDFGIAKGAHVEKLTETGSVVGTPQYLAPEQVRGAPVDERVDVWAAGILLFELLTGRTPFDGLGLEETFGATLYGDLPDVRTLRADVPESVARVVAGALEREVERRPRSARAMRDELEAAITTEGLAIDPCALRSLPAIRKRTLPFGLAGFDMSARRESPRTVPEPSRTDAVEESGSRAVVDREVALLDSVKASPHDVTRGSRVPVVASPSTPPAPDVRSRLAVVSLACVILSLLVVRLASLDPTPEGTPASTPKRAPVASSAPTVRALAPVAPLPAAPAAMVATVAPSGANGSERVRASNPSPRVRAAHVPAPRARPSKTPAEHVVERARRAYARGELEEANRLYDRATVLAPSFAVAWRGFGLTSYELGHSRAARRAMRQYRSLTSQRSE